MANTEAQSTEANAEGTKPEGSSNPWGDDFDADKAWRLVQNLRAENSDLKSENSKLKTERQDRENEGMSELQKLQDRLNELEKAAKDKDRDLALQKVLRKHPELEDIADLLTGDTEDELMAKAERLAKLGKKSDGEGDEQKPGPTELPGMPKPNLTPGHGGDDTEPFDPVAIAKAARR
ncbi:hypothetical protein ARTSIC4J27_243 [Pseudarthrobacter siccitolerans]|uniref:Scaffolding protein n=1 Tax=Pseudarthrobacter siccitolerans TaxID=861266 RepID=A0A024GXU6_9MICC|nr:hypothetical protein [Pseudarthrobacter siccitolerans]CCQ44319.1 hypothetical protein ARTSIC4J27_243 [Pseudarthrobacter siccitolerans]